ncbi:MAG TPA: mechanosensitive ion channel family protein [Thermoanaerobaculia bacterium]|jgi:small-conductance mechanosensitive channel/CRP-like cAMP-binding protein
MIERPPSLFDAARRLVSPLVVLLFASALVFLLARFHVPLTGATGKNYGTFVIGIAAALVVARILDFLVFEMGFRLRERPPAPALLRQLVALLVFGLLLVGLSQAVLSANLTLLLTSSAIITAVIGLSLQESLGNLFSGLALALERTVQVGDLVRSGETIGLVEQLTWRAIKIRTMEGSSILIPNSVASRDRLEVFRRGGLPIARVLHVGLEYETPPSRARVALEDALRDLPGLAQHPTPTAGVRSFDPSVINYEVRYWLEDYARYLEVDGRVRERIWYRLNREKIRFAYPVIRQHQFAAGPLPKPPESAVIPDVIAGTELFAPLSMDERERLGQGARSHRYAEGEIIVREGDETSSMFLIVAGRCAVSAHGDGLSSQRVAVLEEGSAFGEISLLTGEPRIATVRALTEATLVEIDKATLAPILEASPSLVEKLETIILERRRETADRLESAPETDPLFEPKTLRSRIKHFFGLAH